MNFANPTYLWSLLALAIPIAIHLWSKKKVRVIKIGSTKFLDELDPKQTSSIQLNELLLLLLRLFIVGLLALLLAGPQLRTDAQNREITYLVEPSLLDNDKVKSFLDTVPEDSKRILQKGFPVVGEANLENSDPSVPNYWQLASEMERLPSDSIVVLTHAYVRGVHGRLPQVKANIRWLSFDFEPSDKKVIRATSSKEAIALLSISQGLQYLEFEKETLPHTSERIQTTKDGDSLRFSATNGDYQIPLGAERSIKVLMVYNDSLSKELQFIQAAYKAAANYLKISIDLTIAEEDDPLNFETIENLVWLSRNDPPSAAGEVVLFRPDSLAKELLIPGPSKNSYYLTAKLDSKNSIEENLVERLISIMDLNEKIEDNVALYDKRVVPVAELQTPTSPDGKQKMYAKVVELSPWFWGVFLLLMVVERIMAKYRRQ